MTNINSIAENLRHEDGTPLSEKEKTQYIDAVKANGLGRLVFDANGELKEAIIERVEFDNSNAE